MYVFFGKIKVDIIAFESPKLLLIFLMSTDGGFANGLFRVIFIQKTELSS